MKKKKHNNHFSKFKSSIIEASINGKEIDSSTDLTHLFKIAKEMKLLKEYNDTSYFCNFRTKYNNENCIVTLFIIKIDKQKSDVESVIEIMDMLERFLFPILDKSFKKVNGTGNTNIGIIKVISKSPADIIL